MGDKTAFGCNLDAFDCNREISGCNENAFEYSYDQNKRVTERFYSKIATFEWPFSRILSKA